MPPTSDGLMCFRVDAAPRAARAGRQLAAADGQMGCLHEALSRLAALSGDDAMLRALWPHGDAARWSSPGFPAAGTPTGTA